ncbi:MAG TPA: type II methionyl aminopeptidase [Thermoplasmata archaeon]|nr:type II methionyl aminopeptidase [Thermoplasmata archaeon]
MDLSDEVVEKLRRAGKASRDARTFAAEILKEGMTILEGVERIEDFLRAKGCPPAFPTCLSVNDVAAHDTPTHKDDRALRRGDVVKIDLGAQVDGYLTDTAKTVEIGTQNWTDLIRASEGALQAAIEVVRPKVPTRILGGAIERTIESFGYKPIANLTGHSIERYTVHAGKSVPNVAEHGDDVLEEGDLIAIEPFATNGAGKVDGRKSGNIYRVMRVRDVRPESASRFLRLLHETFNRLPFAERWCYRLDRKAPAHLARLLRSGLVYTYPYLYDVGHGIVAQSEHSMIVTGGGAEVLT